MFIDVKKNLPLWIAGLLLAMTSIGFTGCDGDDSQDPSNPTPENPAPEEGVNISLVNNTTLGSVLVDSAGKTLYIFTRDVAGDSKCTSETCLGNWPIFYKAEIHPGEGLNAADFGTITRTDGAMQTTYKGWPLYYYASDAAAGETNGEAAGNVWFAAKPDYSLMLANAQLTGHDGKSYTSAYEEGTGETQYLTDPSGRTLYIFTNDYRNDNNFTAADLSNNGVWPVFNTDIDALPGILNKDDFGHIEIHGQQQLTYKGWPLYYFQQDAGVRGANKGISFPQPGIWPVITKDIAAAPQ